jgi:Domain of unknown function (DUF4748)
MNTARSVWASWGTLMVAGGVAYYFAKKDINAHRREQELKGLRGTEYLECHFPSPSIIFLRIDVSVVFLIVCVWSYVNCVGGR